MKALKEQKIGQFEPYSIVIDIENITDERFLHSVLTRGLAGYSNINSTQYLGNRKETINIILNMLES